MKRDYLFDNIKVLLIFLVVVGHIYGEYKNNNFAFEYLYNFIYLFHMPLFIFISGYFSKDINKSIKGVKKLIFPYIVFNTIWYLISYLQNGTIEIKNILLVPYGLMWYIFCLYIWKKVLPYLIKIPYILPISFTLGLIIGCVPYNNILSIGRLFGFLPYFLLGYYTEATMIDKIRSKQKWLGISLITTGLLFSFIIIYFDISISNVFLNTSYKELGLTLIVGIIYRVVFYILSILISIGLINIISNKENKISHIGRTTITIYLLHVFIRLIMVKIIPHWNMNVIYNIVIILSPIVITYLLSRKFVVNIYNNVFNKK